MKTLVAQVLSQKPNYVLHRAPAEVYLWSNLWSKNSRSIYRSFGTKYCTLLQLIVSLIVLQ